MELAVELCGTNKLKLKEILIKFDVTSENSNNCICGSHPQYTKMEIPKKTSF